MYNPVLLFSVFERNTINRMQFFVGNLYIFGLLLLSTMASAKQEPMTFTFVLAFVLSFVLAFKRVLDLGIHKAWLVLKIIPLVDIIFFLFLLFAVGKKSQKTDFLNN